MNAVETREPHEIPGAIRDRLEGYPPAGGTIEFESAPAGWLAQNGEVRQRDYRAYYWTPQPDCWLCEGTGRVLSVKRRGSTVQCPDCKGSGLCKRQRMTSVTTFLDMICPKPGLPFWAEARGIEGCLEAIRRGEIDPDYHQPVEAIDIVRELKLGADRARDDATDRGLNVHAVSEHYMLTGSPPRPEDHPVEHHGYLQAFSRWALARNPAPLAVEQLVCAPQDGYAGRSDLVCEVDGMRVRYDAKTNEKGAVYESSHFQVQLYERAAVAGGEEPTSLQKIVVFAADGSFREMACAATGRAVEAALAYWREMQPVSSVCEIHNRAEREARKVAA